MQADNDGFLYPIVNETDCIDCGLCEKVCNELHPYEKREPLKVLAAINKDEEVRLKSSVAIYEEYLYSYSHNRGSSHHSAYHRPNAS